MRCLECGSERLDPSALICARCHLPFSVVQAERRGDPEQEPVENLSGQLQQKIPERLVCETACSGCGYPNAEIALECSWCGQSVGRKPVPHHEIPKGDISSMIVYQKEGGRTSSLSVDETPHEIKKLGIIIQMDPIRGVITINSVNPQCNVYYALNQEVVIPTEGLKLLVDGQEWTIRLKSTQ